MSSYDFTVSTSELADKLDGVTESVAVVGGAVTAMQAAVIASERAASDAICQSVDSSFFMLMRSRFSQRLAQFSSTMNSRIGALMETAAGIDHTHRQMREDFNRIKSRYLKQFDRLDRNLEERVHELDRDAMDLARKRATVIMDRQRREVPMVLLSGVDAQNVSLKAVSARVKTRAEQSIASLGEGARRIVRHNRQMDRVLERGAPRQERDVYVPVVYAVVESLVSQGTTTLNVYMPDALELQTQVEFSRAIRGDAAVTSGRGDSNRAQMRAAVVDRIARDGVDPRVAQVMMALFDASVTPQPSQGDGPQGYGAQPPQGNTAGYGAQQAPGGYPAGYESPQAQDYGVQPPQGDPAGYGAQQAPSGYPAGYNAQQAQDYGVQPPQGDSARYGGQQAPGYGTQPTQGGGPQGYGAQSPQGSSAGYGAQQDQGHGAQQAQGGYPAGYDGHKDQGSGFQNGTWTNPGGGTS